MLQKNEHFTSNRDIQLKDGSGLEEFIRKKIEIICLNELFANIKENNV